VLRWIHATGAASAGEAKAIEYKRAPEVVNADRECGWKVQCKCDCHNI
jgi:hypothetical protein